MYQVTDQHRQQFTQELQAEVQALSKRAGRVLQTSFRGMEDHDREWLYGSRQETDDCLVGDMLRIESKLLGWADQGLSNDLKESGLSTVDTINRINLHRTQLSIIAMLEINRMQMESIIQQSAPGIAQLVSGFVLRQFDSWAEGCQHIFDESRLFPIIEDLSEPLIVPGSELTAGILKNIPHRPTEIFDADQMDELLARTLSGGSQELDWEYADALPREARIRKQLLLREGKDGNVLRVMHHLGHIESAQIRQEIMPDVKTLDELLVMAKEVREMVFQKGSWVMDLTSEQLENANTVPGAVLLTLEGLKQDVDFLELEALGTDESSCARFFYLERTDQGSDFTVYGNLILYQQPERLHLWEHIEKLGDDFERPLYCGGLRVNRSVRDISEQGQGAGMLDQVMVTFAKQHGFKNLVARVLDGPEEIANRVAMKIHEKNGWRSTDIVFQETISLPDNTEKEVDWRIITRPVE